LRHRDHDRNCEDHLMASAERTHAAGDPTDPATLDYFISRAGDDADWAQWIAWQIEAAGYSVIVQDWDFGAGTNFVSNMRKALDSARTTIGIYSPAYFASKYTEDEWTAALVLRNDAATPFLPVRVTQVVVPRLLRPIVYVDLVGLDETKARARLLAAVHADHRSRPPQEPQFPGDKPAFPAPDPGRAEVATRVVNSVPVETTHFADRRYEQVQLREFFGDRSVRLVSIVGRPGVGKSALASRVIAGLGEELTSGQPGATGIDTILYLNARKTGLSLERLYTDIKSILDPAAAALLADYWARQDLMLPQKVQSLVERLQDRNLLLLLDGLEAVLGRDGTLVEDGLRAFVDACLSDHRAPRITATTRVDLAIAPEVLSGVRALRLRGGLETADAVAFLRDLDPQNDLGLRDGREEDLLKAVEITGGIPRALQLIVAILQADPAASLPRLLSDEATFGTQVVESLVAEGYRRLGPDEQRVMEVMAVFDRPVTQAAVAFVVHRWWPDLDVRVSLRRLTSSLFAAADRTTGEYLVQSADRAHAYEQIPEPSHGSSPTQGAPPYDRATVEARVADYYASIRKPPVQWRSIEDVRPQIAEFRHRIAAGEYDTALGVLDLIDSEYLFLWGHYTRLIELRKSVVETPAAPRLRAANLASLGIASQVLGEYDAALAYYEGAVETAATAGDHAAHARYIGNLGRLYRNLGWMDRAIASSQQALDAAIEAGDRAAEAGCRDRLGLAYTFVGRLDEAQALLDEAIAMNRELGERGSEGAALCNRGLVLRIRGQVDDAVRDLEESLDIAREVGDRRGDAIISGHLGFVAESQGDYQRALELHRHALAISQELGERREQSYQLLGIGKAHFSLGQLDAAAHCLSLSRELDMPETSYLAAMALGLALQRRGSDATERTFADTLRRCDERLARSAELFGARYTRATALVAMAGTSGDWVNEDQRPGLLAPALAELDRALTTCPGAGIVASTIRDLERLADNGVVGLEPVIGRMEAVLPGSAPEPVTPAMVANEGSP
jgi:tetratricopeptide (TPR) repeat protein